ncbi:hypothetical protein D3C80_974260 [compost metagenome]
MQNQSDVQPELNNVNIFLQGQHNQNEPLRRKTQMHSPIVPANVLKQYIIEATNRICPYRSAFSGSLFYRYKKYREKFRVATTFAGRTQVYQVFCFQVNQQTMRYH